MSRILIEYWTNFAKTGDPNGEGLVQWDQLSANDPKHLELNSKSVFRPYSKDKLTACQFLGQTLARISSENALERCSNLERPKNLQTNEKEKRRSI